MFFHHFSRKPRPSSRKPRAARLAGLRRSKPLSVESLEDRCLLSAAPSFEAMHFDQAFWLGPFLAANHNTAAYHTAVQAAQNTVDTVTTVATKLSASDAQTPATAADTTTTAAATTTTVRLSPAASTYGERVAITATVTTSGSGTPSGQVQFFDGNVAIGTARLGRNGDATLNLDNLSVGDHTITATYLGNADFDTSTSATPAAPNLTVTAANTYTVVTTSANPVAPGDTLTLTARVSAAPQSNTTTSSGDDGDFEGDFEGGCGWQDGFWSQASLPSGTVAFQVTDANGNSGPDLAPAQVIDGVARLSTSSLSAGNYTITATFTPDNTNFTGSTSQQVAQSVSSTLSATRIPVNMSPRHGLAAGDAVTYTVRVTPKDSGSTSAAPTGTVSFTDAVTGAALAGSPVTLGSDGTATLSTTCTTDPIIVSYAPDSSSSSTYANSQVILPLDGQGEHEGRRFGEGDFGSRLHDMALARFLADFLGY